MSAPVEPPPPPIDPPPPVPPAPLTAIFAGRATTTTTHNSAPGPYETDISLELQFDAARTTVTITGFPPLKTPPFDTPYGRNVTTITKTGGGAGTYSAGAGAIPLTLRFDHSIDLPFFEEDSDITLTLSTDAPGSPVDTAGVVTLVGSGVFKKGFLGGATGTISITGTITPVP